MMLCLRRASIILLFAFAACKPTYQKFRKLPEPAAQAQSSTLMGYRPGKERAEKVVYRCLINGKLLFKSFHLSGILLFRQMDDGSARVLFTNELGMTFFDFGWDRVDSFQVYRILPQLDKPALIQMLREDLSVVLMREIKPVATYRKENETIYQAALEKTQAYYSIKDGRISSIELADKKLSRTVTYVPGVLPQNLPDSFSIEQHGPKFSIQSKRIPNASFK
jgi:hypothetical protein